MLYLHIPFCQSRCIYCDFYSTTQTPRVRSEFVDALCRELEARVGEMEGREVPTVYFGGGTPSQLGFDEIAQIMQTIRRHYRLAPEAELTFEANPDDITPELVAELRRLGFNRVSLGVQSFDDELLSLIRRRHSAVGAVRAVEMLVAGGLTNVSIDLIYGLPGQTLEGFRQDLVQAFSLPIKHLSSYALSVEEGTVLSCKVKSGELQLADEELSLGAYNALIDAAAAAGFEHYEISNFCLPGFHSRHNSAYWDGTPYLGLGPGAHSFDSRDRRFNLPDLKAYIASPGFPPHELERLTDEERFNELVFTALRTHRGLLLRAVEASYGTAVVSRLLCEAEPHLKAGRLERQGDILRLTRAGLFVSDDVMSDLMRCEPIVQVQLSVMNPGVDRFT